MKKKRFSVMKLLLSPFGRTGRLFYWLGLGVAYLIAFIATAAVGISEIAPRHPEAADALVFAGFGMAFYIFSVLLSKRVHDLGRRAWPFVVPAGIAFAGLLASVFIGSEAREATFALTAILALIAIAAGLLRGQRGENMWGMGAPTESKNIQEVQEQWDFRPAKKRGVGKIMAEIDTTDSGTKIAEGYSGPIRVDAQRLIREKRIDLSQIRGGAQ